mmetsp:Transcript_22058/g.65331  ORF Transcript_22058/g.65331 Transcript_22058/m.65331 type:complete len:126 (-) Transcript_22058:200-577(-)
MGITLTIITPISIPHHRVIQQRRLLMLAIRLRVKAGRMPTLRRAAKKASLHLKKTEEEARQRGLHRRHQRQAFNREAQEEEERCPRQHLLLLQKERMKRNQAAHNDWGLMLESMAISGPLCTSHG